MQLKLNEVRLNKGVTWEWLADKSCISLSHLRKFHYGTRNVQLRHIKKLAQVLSVSPHELLPEDFFPLEYPKKQERLSTAIGAIFFIINQPQETTHDQEHQRIQTPEVQEGRI